MPKRVARVVRILSGKNSAVQDDAPLGRLEHVAHFCALVWQSFVRNRCLVRASALSYASLLALIPLLAVAISVTSSLLKSEGESEIYHAIDKFVANVVPPATLGLTNAPAASTNVVAGSTNAIAPTNEVVTPETNAVATIPSSETENTNFTAAQANDARVVAAQKKAAESIHQFVQNTSSKTIGMTGMVVLVFIAISMLSRIEETFNDIWGISRGRPWLWRIVLYWATITLGPLLAIGALGLAGGTHFHTVEEFIKRTPFMGELVFKILPIIVLWLLFAAIYMLVPNTKVRFTSALVGGIVAGTAWHLNNMFGFLYISRVVTNSKIYGSLGLVPVFMAGLYFSWVILLFGAQVAYAFQNRRVYLQDKLVENVNQRGREFVALRLMTCIGQRFQSVLGAPTVHDMSVELGIPTRLVQQVLQTLMGAKLVTEISGAEPAYIPARPIDAINVHHILQAMRAGGGQELMMRDEPVRAEVYGEFARIEEAERQAASSITLLALANRAQARLQLAEPQTESKPEPKAIAEKPVVAEPAQAPITKIENPEPEPKVEKKVEVVVPEELEKHTEVFPEPEVKSEEKREVARPPEEREFPL